MPVFFPQPAAVEGGIAPRNIDNQYGMADLQASAMPGDFVEFTASGVGALEITLACAASGKSIPYSVVGGNAADKQLCFIMPNEDVVFNASFDVGIIV